MEPIRTRYAKNGDISVAYQVFGEGDVDLVIRTWLHLTHRELLG